MIEPDTTLINQVNHLETDEDDRVKRSEVVALIDAMGEDLHQMSEEQALRATQNYLQEKLYEADETMMELGAMEFDDDPAVLLYQTICQDLFMDLLDEYRADLSIASDVISFELDELNEDLSHQEFFQA